MSGVAITAPTPGSAWPGKIDGRTHQPVRRDSQPAEAAETWYRPLPKGRAAEIMRQLRRAYRVAHQLRDGGRRWGLISPIDLEVVEALLFKGMDWATGKLDWSYQQIMDATGRARDTVRHSLANLKALGVVDWIRRFERTEVEGKGPQVRQITNAYRIAFPRGLRKLIGMRADTPPKPDDSAIAERDRANAVLAMEAGARGKPSLDEALNRLADRLAQREARKRSDSPGPMV